MHTRKLMTLAAIAVVAFSACTPVASTAPTSGSGATSGPPATTAPTAAAGPNAELTAALAKEYEGETVDVLAQWIEADGTAFDESMDAFRDATGINVVYSGISNYETVLGVRVDGGIAPDIAQLAQSGRMKSFAADGKLIDLDTVLDGEYVRENYSPGFVEAGTGDDGKLYGLYYRQDLKSIVWYPVQAFEAAGYAPPTSWAELQALTDKIKADGNGSPWCTTIEHDDVSGWVATDWLEDVVLRTAGAETYDKWARHEIPFNDAAIVEALDVVGEVWFTEGNTYGGAERINATWVGDSQTPMFDDPPKCWLHKQASWIPDFWPEGKEPGTDSKFFYFPAIEEANGNPVLGGSDMLVMFNDRPEVRALMQWFSTPESVQSRVEAGGFISANNAVPADWYAAYPWSDLAEIARTSTVSRADASDALPPETQKIIHTALIKWVQQEGADSAAILGEIEGAWPQ
jgi:alpha-glucoside transport system substrate-binding protein